MAAEVDPRAPTRTSRLAADGPGRRTGERIGRYVVERTLGAGGMGVVIEARDPELQRQVALKLLRSDAGDRAFRARLVREARAQASLDHPNVVRVYDAGEADGDVFIAMELVVGRSLGAWLRAVRRPWREVLARCVEAGRGLAAAHAAGMVHRDFKPENVLVRDSDGRVLVTDFGLAVAADREPQGAEPSAPAAAVTPISGDEPTVDGGGPSGDAGAAATGSLAVTATGVAVGTPPYMAPEQHAGGSVDARADVFSFCVSLYEGVYGERPFEVDGARRYDPLAWVEAIDAGRVRPPADGRRVPAALRRALVRGLAADPGARWPSMEALLAALDGVRARRRRVLLALGGAGAAAAIAVATFAATRSSPLPAIDRCADEAARVARTWSPDARDRVSRALLATGKAYAPVAASRATEAFDRWSGEWRDVRESTCHDADRGALAAKDWRGVSSCLDDALADLGSRVDVLVGERAAVDHVADIVDLTSPRGCARVGVDAPPDDPKLAAEVSAARAELHEIDKLGALGRWADVAPRARVLLARARALGWRPLIDEAANLLGVASAGLELPAEAEPLLREVEESAAARGDDTLAARSATGLLQLMAHTRRFDGIDYLASAARASAERAHNPHERLLIDAHVGKAYVAAGRVVEARSLCESALAKVAPATKAYLERSELLDCLSLVAQAERRWSDELDLAEQTLHERILLAGPRHQIVATTLSQIALVMNELGRPNDALIAQLTAHGFVEETSGADSAAAALSWAQLAEIRVALHDSADARVAIDRATAIIERATVEDDRDREEVTRARAQVLEALGDADGAVAALGTLAADVARRRPGTPEDFASTLIYGQSLQDVHRCGDALPALDAALLRGTSLHAAQKLVLLIAKANCQLDLGRAADAAHDLAPAWAAVDPSTIPVTDRAMIVYTLARVFEKAGDRKRALDFARKARVDIVATPSLADYRESIDDIIKRLGGGPPPHASSSSPAHE